MKERRTGKTGGIKRYDREEKKINKKEVKKCIYSGVERVESWVFQIPPRLKIFGKN